MTDVHNETKKLLRELAKIKDPRKTPAYKERAIQALERETRPELSDLPSLPDADPPADTSVGFELWEALAYDLALESMDEDSIVREYGLSRDSYESLRMNRFFMKMLETKREEVKSLGGDAAFTVKMRMIVNRATHRYMNKLLAEDTNTKDFHSMFKTAVELAQLVPDTDEDNPQQVLGTQVTFNIQGVPGLEHLHNASEPIEGEVVDTSDPKDDDLQEL